MKEKIKYIVVVVIAIIIIGIGMTYSYFRVGVSEEGRGEEVIVDTAEIMRTKLTISGEIEFQDQDIYPGHKNVSSIKVEATGEDRVVYNVVWRGENTLNTPLKYYVYKTSSKKDPKISCSKRIEGNVVKKYYEECIEEGFEELGSIIGEGTITNTKEMKFILKDQEEIEANPEGKEVYYYVVIEYPNLDEDQYPLDKGGKFQGEVGIEVLSGTAIKPEIKNITTSKTENSITIGVEASDNSGIGGYYYKIGKEEYVRRDEATYTFSGLEEYKEYEIRVYVEDIYGNRSEEDVRKVRTEDVTSPQIIITNNVEEGENGWYKSVEVIGEARDEGAGVNKIKYCITTGSTCTPNTEINNQGEVRLNSNTNSQKVCYEAEDGSGNKSKVVCSGGYKVDQDQPTVVISSTSSTESTITINLSGRDSHSGIQSYKYSINNGAYIKTTDSTHTFTGLESGTSYSIKVQVVDKAGNVSSEVTTNVITTVLYHWKKYSIAYASKEEFVPATNDDSTYTVPVTNAYIAFTKYVKPEIVDGRFRGSTTYNTDLKYFRFVDMKNYYDNDDQLSDTISIGYGSYVMVSVEKEGEYVYSDTYYQIGLALYSSKLTYKGSYATFSFGRNRDVGDYGWTKYTIEKTKGEYINTETSSYSNTYPNNGIKGNYWYERI